MSSKTYYDILGVAPNASQDEIRTAFRSAAKRYHPDIFLSYIQKVRATAKMQEINAAYAVLRNPDNRRVYDATLPSRGSKAQQPTSESGGAEATSTPRARYPFRMDPWNFWGTVVWLITSLALGCVQWSRSAKESITLGSFLQIAAFSLIISPFLLIIAAMVLLFPAMIVGKVFSDRFESRQRAMPKRKVRIVLDMLIRLIGLAAIVAVGIDWHIESMPVLLAYALLAAAAGLIGEIAALILYLSRRSVVHSTEMLLRVN